MFILDSKSEVEAEEIIKTTDSSIKNELLFTKFGINYNSENEVYFIQVIENRYRKGTTIIRKYVLQDGTVIARPPSNRKQRKGLKTEIEIGPFDLIKDNPLKLNLNDEM